jgi:hypothetical protein
MDEPDHVPALARLQLFRRSRRRSTSHALALVRADEVGRRQNMPLDRLL